MNLSPLSCLLIMSPKYLSLNTHKPHLKLDSNKRFVLYPYDVILDKCSIHLSEWDRFVCRGFLSKGSSLTACQRSLERSGITDVRRKAMDQPVTVDVHEVTGKESKTSEKEVVKTTRRSTDRTMEYCMYVCMNHYIHVYVKKVDNYVNKVLSSNPAWHMST